STVLQRVVRALREAGVDHVLVVIGPHVPELVPPAQAEGAAICLLPQETDDMRATVAHGLAWLEDRFHPRAGDSWLLAPADHPTRDPVVVRRLLGARQEHPDKSIVIPTFQGRRGHPALIGWHHVAPIRALSPGQGLNSYFRQAMRETLEMP